MSLSFSNPNVTTWATLVRDLLRECGMGDVWLNQYVSDEGIFKTVFRQRLYDMYSQNWCSDISITSSYRLYKHLKNIFEFEPYLDLEKKHLRIALSKIRLSSHLFMIERGRWEKGGIERKERKCCVCGVIEDEFHCLFECPRFMEERKGCVDSRMRDKPSMYKFLAILSSKDISIQKGLGTLCFRVHKKYKELLL